MFCTLLKLACMYKLLTTSTSCDFLSHMGRRSEGGGNYSMEKTKMHHHSHSELQINRASDGLCQRKLSPPETMFAHPPRPQLLQQWQVGLPQNAGK